MSRKKAVDIIRINDRVRQEVADEIIAENLLNIYINKEYYASLMCTPYEKIELAIGFLFADGIIASKDSIKSAVELTENIVCIMLEDDLEANLPQRRAITSGCAGGSSNMRAFEYNDIKPVSSNCKYSTDDIFMLMKEFNHRSELFRQTGGVHSCAVCSNNEILYFSEDIGRHNALDKVIGKALINETDRKDKLLMTTGRISSDIAFKAAKAGIPVVVSHSAPTDMALELAQKANITMIGFVRGNRMNIYCGDERII